MFETLAIEYRDGISTIWMNRPQLHNAFNAELIAELTRACEQLAAEAQTRVVVLAGRGRSFSAGADLNWMRAAAHASQTQNLDDARQLANMLRTLAQLPKPTIARVHGAALGGGMGLACACDICLATPAARFATSEVRFGIIPSAISPYVIRAIGARQASRYFLSAERIDAERAAAIGLAHEVVADASLDERLDEIARALCEGGPLAQAEAKTLIAEVANRPIDETLIEHTSQRIATLRTSAEAQEGLSAFLEKRAPLWQTQDH